ncbi:MAG: 2-dehydropantoate 2-reductase [Methanobacteriota archaeon]|nr:MAG: 2-dehydropantoate 2-reductase [Euryarchaeota archaeon]
MRVIVFGAGALGSLIGGLLSQKNEVIFVGRKQHLDAIQRDGLRIKGTTELVVHPHTKEELDGNEDPELIMITTKSYDTEEAMRALDAFHWKSVFLSLQNGLENEEIISGFAARVVGGVTSHGVTLEGPGEIYHAGVGDTILGNYAGAEDGVLDIVNAFNESGIETQASDDIRKEIWKKVIVNAGINPLTAIARCKNGVLLEDAELERDLEDVCRGAVLIANAHGIEISVEDAISQTKKVARLTANNKSSMLQDVENGKPTEIDSICGAISKLGEEKGIPTPVNSSLTAIVKGLEKSSS